MIGEGAVDKGQTGIRTELGYMLFPHLTKEIRPTPIPPSPLLLVSSTMGQHTFDLL
jgi:hypothetical protein